MRCRYVNSELQGTTAGSPAEDVLSTIRLRLLELVGEGLSPDVAVLPRLLSEDSPEGLRRATHDYLREFSTPGKDLFLLNLRLLRKEMGKKYNGVDPELVQRMDQVEEAVVDAIVDDTRDGSFKQEHNELQ